MSDLIEEIEAISKCSFCNQTQHEVRFLIAGPSIFICDECVAACIGILEKEFGPDWNCYTAKEQSGQ